MFRLNHIKKLINIKEKIFKIDNIVDENFKEVIEGINRSIKVQKHIAYGYKSFFNFRNRILIKANLIA